MSQNQLRTRLTAPTGTLRPVIVFVQQRLSEHSITHDPPSNLSYRVKRQYPLQAFMTTDVHTNKVSKEDKMLLVSAYIARAHTYTCH